MAARQAGAGLAPAVAARQASGQASAATARLDALRSGLAPVLEAVWGRLAPLRRILACVTGLGWTVLVAGLLSWLASWALGWAEFAYAAAALLALFVLATGFTIGRMRLRVALEVTPQRVSAGQAANARFEIVNTARSPLLSMGVELPVGANLARYTTPTLAPGAPYEDWVTIPTARRGVVEVGPVRTQRGDPLGLVRREVAWTEVVELFIHPTVVPIPALGTGLLRDLEGRTTQDVSQSDLAFHTVREYIQGDDQRHIHWPSTAKVSAIAGELTFMVRQFLDTRRSHVVVVTDVAPEAYADEDEFETALSVSASIAVRAISDTMDLSVACGSQRVSRPAPHAALDAYSRAHLEPVSLSESVAKLRGLARDASLLVAVTGSRAEFGSLQRARSLAPHQVRMVVLRITPGAPITARETSGFTELDVGELADLPRALAGGVTV